MVKNTAPLPAPDAGERLLDVMVVARRLGVSSKTVRREIAAGALVAHRLGRLLRVSERDLLAYVAARRLGAGR